MKFTAYVLASFTIGFIIGVVYKDYEQLRVKNSFKEKSFFALEETPESAVISKKINNYFYSSISDNIKSKIKNDYSSFSLVSTCELNLIPGGLTEFVVSLNSENSNEVLIFERSDVRNLKVLNLTQKLKNISKNENLEVHCRQSSSIVNHPNFKPQAGLENLYSTLTRSNFDVLLIKNKSTQLANVLSLNFDTQDLDFIGFYEFP